MFNSALSPRLLLLRTTPFLCRRDFGGCLDIRIAFLAFLAYPR
jgi:hypothetical protein